MTFDYNYIIIPLQLNKKGFKMEKVEFVYLTVVIEKSKNRKLLLKKLEKDGFKKKISNVYEKICKDNYSAEAHIEYLKKCREETISNLSCYTYTSENIHLNDFKYGL